MFLAVDLALFFNQYVNPIALNHIGWKYYIVYDVWIAFELLIVWKYYIETRNTPLEEIVKHFDGDSAILGGQAATEKSRQLAAEIDVDPTQAPVRTNADEKNDPTVLQTEQTTHSTV